MHQQTEKNMNYIFKQQVSRKVPNANSAKIIEYGGIRLIENNLFYIFGEKLIFLKNIKT